jgi:Ran GTPase-activating protein (RanGAP) involved in mRNA processing and transport
VRSTYSAIIEFGWIEAMSTELETSEVAILSRVIKPDSGDWPHAAAEAILRIGFNETDQGQMIALLEKAKAGDLTSEESEALEHYRHIGKLLELMKSRARRSLTIK